MEVLLLRVQQQQQQQPLLSPTGGALPPLDMRQVSAYVHAWSEPFGSGVVSDDASTLSCAWVDILCVCQYSCTATINAAATSTPNCLCEG